MINQNKSNSLSQALSHPRITLFLAGINLILLNFIMVQHLIVAIRKDELAVVLFSLTFFGGISLGLFFSDKIKPAHVNVLFPFFLLIQIVILLFTQIFFGFISKTLGDIAAILILWLIITVFSTSFYSLFLPVALQSLKLPLRKLYGIEILGSIFGLILLPLITNISHELLLTFYFLIYLAIGITIHIKKRILVILLVVTCLYVYPSKYWDAATAGVFYKGYYDSKGVSKIVETLFTPYHKIEIALMDSGHYALFLNGKHQYTDRGRRSYSFFVAGIPAALLKNPNTAILGCGSMATVGRIGLAAPKITIVDIDEKVFEKARKYFGGSNRLNELDNWIFKADDAKHFLANTHESFDLILHDIPPARSRQTALTYTNSFFGLVKERLSPMGIFSISMLSPIDSSKSQYGKKILATLASVFDNYFAIQYGKATYFYGGTESMPEFSAEDIQALAKQHNSKRKIKILYKKDIQELVQDVKIISHNNVGDLIFD